MNRYQEERYLLSDKVLSFYKEYMIEKKKKTKIVATIGPASDTQKTVVELINNGMNVVRMNFSHEDHAKHHARVKTVRRAARICKKHIAILFDLGGPKIRTGDFVDGEVVLKKGATFTFTTTPCRGDERQVSISYKKLPKEVRPGSIILLDDGTKKFRVTRVSGNRIITTVINGGRMKSRRGVNVPGASLSISSLTAKDKRDVAFGVEVGVDFFALSFVRSAKDIRQLRRLLKKHGSHAQIVAKIETKEALEDIDAIIEATDAVMVARGDLAVEIGPVHVPHMQKKIIFKCNVAAKPVIVATQMLESMISAPVPTRAEVNDVTNAILDGTDAVMLSAETAIGAYPVETMRVMRDIALRTEQEPYFQRRMNEIHARISDVHSVVNAITLSVVHTAHDIDARAIVALTESGFTARHIARYHPVQPIIAFSPTDVVCRQLMLSFGCYPRKISGFRSLTDTIRKTLRIVRTEGFGHTDDLVVLSAGIPFCQSGTTNMMVIERV